MEGRVCDVEADEHKGLEGEVERWQGKGEEEGNDAYGMRWKADVCWSCCREMTRSRMAIKKKKIGCAGKMSMVGGATEKIRTWKKVSELDCKRVRFLASHTLFQLTEGRISYRASLHASTLVRQLGSMHSNVSVLKVPSILLHCIRVARL